MDLTLSPEIQSFIDREVRSGRFPTPEAVVEAAIEEWRNLAETALDDETVAAINRAEEQADRGEGTDLETFRERMKRRAVRP